MNPTFKNILSYIRELYHVPNEFIPLHAPVFFGNEKKYLEECIDTTFVSSVGKFVNQFELEIANYTGSVKAVSCVSGTSALHLALKLIGVQAETEVITQPLTFVATANAILYCNAQPVFIDIDRDTLGLSPSALLNFIENHTLADSKTNRRINVITHKPISACLPVHTFGFPCRIDEIVEICSHYGIPVVEDAAESIGSFYKRKHTGTFGDIGILSFNGNKTITTGSGGMLLFKNSSLAARAKHLTTQAKIPHPWEFIHDELGYNYRMSNVNAALGLAQLEQLTEFLIKKREIANCYESFFKETDISYIKEPENSISNFWLNSIILTDKNERDAFLKYSNDHKVMTRPAWMLMNMLPMYNHCQSIDINNSIWFAERLVNLPSSVKI